MQRGIFIGVTLALFLLVDFYLFSAVRQLVRSWSPGTQRITTYIYWSIPVISLLLFFITFFWFNDKLSFKLRTFLASFILIIYISKLFSAVILILSDVLRAGEWSWKKLSSIFSSKTEGNISQNSSEEIGSKITRSDFLAKTALAIGATHVGAMTWGIVSGAYDYRIRRVPLKLANLPKAFHGMKLVQISDIHSGSFFNKTAVQGGVDMLLKEKPDMVFFTGDLVNNKAEELSDYFDVFKKVKAPLGVFSTLGNHDYGDYVQWDNPEAKAQNLQTLMKGHELLGWDLLMDSSREIKVDNESISVLGIQNWGKGFSQHGDLKKALSSVKETPVKLLLSHDPSHWREQVLDKTDIDVSFAGHTHGMQYGVEIGKLKWSPVQWRYKEWAGLYQENEQQLYVNRGYGFLGYPGRLGILPEITVFELQKA